MDRIEYMIVDECGTFAAEELKDRVNQLLQQGWRPQGGVAVAGEGVRGPRLLQALIRETGLRES